MTPESSRRCLSVCEIPLRCSTGWPALYSQAPGKLNGGRGPLTNPRTSPSAPERRPRCQIASRGAGKCLMNSGFLVWPPRACGRPGADGSELAGKAVQHGIALAKRIGAGVTVLTVLPPFHTFTTDAQMIEDTPDQYKVCMQKHASLVAVWRQKTGNSERSRPTALAARDEIADGDHSTF